MDIHARLKPAKGSFRKVLRLCTYAVGGILILGALVLIYALALRYVPYRLPAPTGGFHVGRTEYDFTDSSRVDPLAPQKNTKRKLIVMAWYPTDTLIKGKRAPYFPSAWANALNTYQGFNQFGLHDYGSMRTNASANVPIAHDGNKFPVLILEPGLGLTAPDYTLYAENLASHGYIVAGVTPTYSADVAVFLDGSIAKQNQLGLISNANSNSDAERLLDIWTRDVTFVVR